MITPAPLRKGWCPGALRPMQSGDGLLLRVRPKGGTFSIPSLLAIAETSGRFASGEIDLTNRGNLQLRGVSATTYPAALEMLAMAGLIDSEIGAESVRNVVVDPLSGLDPTRADVRRLANELENALVTNEQFWALPGKFGFSFSGSSCFCVGGRSADVMLAAAHDGQIAITLDGDPSVVAQVSYDESVVAAQRIASVFLQLHSQGQTFARMRDAVASRGSVEVFARARLTATRITRAEAQDQSSPVGLLADSRGVFGVGVGLPFGRILANQLNELSRKAASLGIRAANSSPERILVFSANSGQASALLDEARQLRLITAAADPRLAMDVCPGAPACPNATTATRDDAQRLVEAITSMDAAVASCSLHVSGCEKGCAHRGTADITLVAHDGHYDIIRDGDPGGPITAAGVAPSEIAVAVGRLLRQRLQ